MIGQLTKAHGTGNDFVLLLDPTAKTPLSAAQVALLADRRRGVGGDGVIRIVRSEDFAVSEPTAAAAHAGGAQWFMDYRNADGSIAEMCGNGVRVFAHFLREQGLVDATEFAVGTRAGVKNVEVITDPRDPATPWYRVDMGEYAFPQPIAQPGADAPGTLVETPGVRVARPALDVDMGNPHTVVALATFDELAQAQLFTAPTVTPVPPAGTNVEFIVISPDSGRSEGVLRMRVHERGVGETLACGTGACASALAARSWAGAGAPSVWDVEQPGGTVRVEVISTHAFLSGPAQLIATVSLTPAFAQELERVGDSEPAIG